MRVTFLESQFAKRLGPANLHPLEIGCHQDFLLDDTRLRLVVPDFDLDAPIERLAMPDIPSPHSLGLLEVVVPSVARIMQTIRDVASV